MLCFMNELFLTDGQLALIPLGHNRSEEKIKIFLNV